MTGIEKKKSNGSHIFWPKKKPFSDVKIRHFRNHTIYIFKMEDQVCLDKTRNCLNDQGAYSFFLKQPALWEQILSFKSNDQTASRGPH